MTTVNGKKRKVDPEHMREIASSGGLATKKKRGSAWFSEIAKRSHPRESYTAGPGRGNRKKKDPDAVADSN